MPQWTLCVRFGTQSVPGCIPTQSVGTIRKPRNPPTKKPHRCGFFVPAKAPLKRTATTAG
ncbi:hypothetical protein C1893_11730 [Pseudomonas sp. MPR-ANC1]|nr:hypothetical protein C1893_11730 [Pseudomonas sp. MPR-ANC1]